MDSNFAGGRAGVLNADVFGVGAPRLRTAVFRTRPFDDLLVVFPVMIL
jgi:hypothetical protein